MTSTNSFMELINDVFKKFIIDILIEIPVTIPPNNPSKWNPMKSRPIKGFLSSKIIWSHVPIISWNRTILGCSCPIYLQMEIIFYRTHKSLIGQQYLHEWREEGETPTLSTLKMSLWCPWDTSWESFSWACLRMDFLPTFEGQISLVETYLKHPEVENHGVDINLSMWSRLFWEKKDWRDITMKHTNILQ